MIPPMIFYCPRCGAPGQTVHGSAEYSCMCRYQNAQARSPKCTCKWESGHNWAAHKHDPNCPQHGRVLTQKTTSGA